MYLSPVFILATLLLVAGAVPQLKQPQTRSPLQTYYFTCSCNDPSTHLTYSAPPLCQVFNGNATGNTCTFQADGDIIGYGVFTDRACAAEYGIGFVGRCNVEWQPPSVTRYCATAADQTAAASYCSNNPPNLRTTMCSSGYIICTTGLGYCTKGTCLCGEQGIWTMTSIYAQEDCSTLFPAFGPEF